MTRTEAVSRRRYVKRNLIFCQAVIGQFLVETSATVKCSLTVWQSCAEGVFHCMLHIGLGANHLQR